MTFAKQPEYFPLEHLDVALSPWQSKIMSGNQAFQDGEFLAARDKYKTALTVALSLLDQFADARVDESVLKAVEHCCPAVVVAAHNLADCYLALSEPEKACAQLIWVHRRISKLTYHEDFGVTHIAFHHLHKTRQELIQFASRFPHLPELIADINEAMQPHVERKPILH